MKNIILNTELTNNQIGIFYIGQVGFIIKYQNKYVMIDGYLSDYVDKHCCSENVLWERLYPAPINASDLDFIDYAFCTHSHYDHTDPYTIADMLKVNNNVKFICPYSVKENLIEYGASAEKIIVADDGDEINLDGISFKAIASAHEELNYDENNHICELGYIIKLGEKSIYHSGDCCLYDGLIEKIKDVSIAMIPINGRDYFRNKNDIIGCFDSVEASTLTKEANIDLLIPTHFDLYEVNCVNPAYFVDTLNKFNPTQKYKILRPGETLIY